MRALLLISGLAVLASACDLSGIRGGDSTDPRLSLSLDVSQMLDWGGVSSVQLTLGNTGDTPSGDVHVELYFPSWMEFSSVDPEGTEVRLLSSGDETRLAYRIGDPELQPGETRTIVQRVRIPRREAGAAPVAPTTISDTAAADTAGVVEEVPFNRTLRARLVSSSGEQLGAEIRTVMPFRGADNSAALPVGGAGAIDPAAQARIQGDRVGPVQLGATTAEARRAAPGARDTTFTLGEGMREQGLIVPLGGGRTALAMIVDDRVDRIIVRDRGLQTDLGYGVGSTHQQLRQAYGSACTAQSGDGRTVVWFPNLPGISFAFDGVPATRDTAAAGAARPALPDGAQVRELWVRRGVDRC